MTIISIVEKLQFYINMLEWYQENSWFFVYDVDNNNIKLYYDGEIVCWYDNITNRLYGNRYHSHDTDYRQAVNALALAVGVKQKRLHDVIKWAACYDIKYHKAIDPNTNKTIFAWAD